MKQLVIQDQPKPSFCPDCYRIFDAGSLVCSVCIPAEGATSAPISVQRISDKIVDTLGLERIEGFQTTNFFADIFKKRTPEEVETHFSFGFPGRIPDLASIPDGWPRPWSFLRVLLSGLLLFAIFDVSYSMFENLNLIPGLILTGSFAAPVAMVVFFYEMNIVRNISVYHLARLFLLGGVASLFLTLLIDTLVPIDSLIGDPAAGVTEEVAKLAIVVAAVKMMRLGPQPYLLNGLLIGATIGAGFAAFESAGYAFQVLAGTLQGTTVEHVIMLRGILSPFAHIAWTTIAAGALWRVWDGGKLNTEVFASPRFLKLFALPVILHAVWDLDVQLPFMGKYVVLGAIAVVAVLSLLQSGIRQVSAVQRAEADRFSNMAVSQ